MQCSDATCYIHNFHKKITHWLNFVMKLSVWISQTYWRVIGRSRGKLSGLRPIRWKHKRISSRRRTAAHYRHLIIHADRVDLTLLWRRDICVKPVYEYFSIKFMLQKVLFQQRHLWRLTSRRTWLLAMRWVSRHVVDVIGFDFFANVNHYRCHGGGSDNVIRLRSTTFNSHTTQMSTFSPTIILLDFQISVHLPSLRTFIWIYGRCDITTR